MELDKISEGFKLLRTLCDAFQKQPQILFKILQYLQEKTCVGCLFNRVADIQT